MSHSYIFDETLLMLFEILSQTNSQTRAGIKKYFFLFLFFSDFQSLSPWEVNGINYSQESFIQLKTG